MSAMSPVQSPLQSPLKGNADAQAQHTYTFDVAMTCGGCSGAVQRVLSKMDGLDIEKVDWESKEVIVHAPTGQPDFDAVLAKIEKTGKKVNAGHDNGVQRYPKPDGEAQA